MTYQLQTLSVANPISCKLSLANPISCKPDRGPKRATRDPQDMQTGAGMTQIATHSAFQALPKTCTELCWILLKTLRPENPLGILSIPFDMSVSAITTDGIKRLQAVHRAADRSGLRRGRSEHALMEGCSSGGCSLFHSAHLFTNPYARKGFFPWVLWVFPKVDPASP